MKNLHFMSSCTESTSEVPTLFCAWHEYKPESRRPTGRSWRFSDKLAISDRPALRHTIDAGGLASASHLNAKLSFPSSKSICGAPSNLIVGASDGWGWDKKKRELLFWVKVRRCWMWFNLILCLSLEGAFMRFIKRNFICSSSSN